MDKRKVYILVSVFLCVICFLVELFLIEKNGKENDSITKLKSTFYEEIQALRDGKYENLTAMDFEASIEDVENVYHLQILHPKGYANQSFLENFTFVIEGDVSQEENTLELLWNPNYKNQKMRKKIDAMNKVIDVFFQTEVDKTDFAVDYWVDDEYVKVEYLEFADLLAEGLNMV